MPQEDKSGMVLRQQLANAYAKKQRNKTERLKSLNERQLELNLKMQATDSEVKKEEQRRAERIKHQLAQAELDKLHGRKSFTNMYPGRGVRYVRPTYLTLSQKATGNAYEKFAKLIKLSLEPSNPIHMSIIHALMTETTDEDQIVNSVLDIVQELVNATRRSATVTYTSIEQSPLVEMYKELQQTALQRGANTRSRFDAERIARTRQGNTMTRAEIIAAHRDMQQLQDSIDYRERAQEDLASLEAEAIVKVPFDSNESIEISISLKQLIDHMIEHPGDKNNIETAAKLVARGCVFLENQSGRTPNGYSVEHRSLQDLKISMRKVTAAIIVLPMSLGEEEVLAGKAIRFLELIKPNAPHATAPNFDNPERRMLSPLDALQFGIGAAARSGMAESAAGVRNMSYEDSLPRDPPLLEQAGITWSGGSRVTRKKKRTKKAKKSKKNKTRRR